MSLSNIRLRTGLLLSIVVALLCLALVRWVSPVVSAEHRMADVRLSLFAQSTPVSNGIVLVLVQNETLQQYAYSAPVDRQLIAELLQKISAAEPQAIGLTLPLVKSTELSKDAELARVIQNLNVPFYTASDWPSGYAPSEPANFLLTFVSPEQTAPVRPEADSDGVTRRYQFQTPPDVLGMAWRLAGQQPQGGSQPVIRLQRTANLWQGPFARYPAHAIDEVRPEWLTGKTVLIGLDVPDRDRVRVAWSGWPSEAVDMPLVEFHAQALSNMKKGSLLYDLHLVLHVALLWAFSAFVLWSGTWVASTRMRLILTFGLIAVWTLFAHGLFEYGFWLSVLDGWMAAVLSVLLSGYLVKQGHAQKQSFAKGLIKRYIAPELLRKAQTKPTTVHDLEQPVELALLAARWKVPEGGEGVAQAQSEFARVCTLIADHGGFVVSAQSHQVLAAFNTPVELVHYKSRACTCAVRILSLFKQLEHLSEPTIELALDSGQAGPSAEVRPGGFWVSGAVTNRLAELQTLHVSCDVPLLASEGFEGELRDPNWEWIPASSKDLPSDLPLFTVRLAAGRP